MCLQVKYRRNHGFRYELCLGSYSKTHHKSRYNEELEIDRFIQTITYKTIAHLKINFFNLILMLIFYLNMIYTFIKVEKLYFN